MRLCVRVCVCTIALCMEALYEALFINPPEAITKAPINSNNYSYSHVEPYAEPDTEPLLNDDDDDDE